MEESWSVALVNVAAMPDSDHEDEEDVVVHLVDDPIVAGAHSPIASAADQLLGAARSWLVCQELNGRLDPSLSPGVQPAEPSGRGWGDLDAVSHAKPRSALT